MCNADKAVALTGCSVALGTLVAVALFQSQAIDRLPDPPGDIFDSERITLSRMAHPLGIPDSYLGLASYSTTLGLLLLSGRCKLARQALGFKLAADVGAAGFNAIRQVTHFGKLCSWCTGTALATFVMAYGGREAIVHSFGDAAREVRAAL